MEAFRGVADYRKSAAGLRTVLSKRGHENMTARPHGSANLLDIGLAISCMGEEMKNRAIVPDRVGALVELDSQDIRQHPPYPGRFRAETIPGDLQSRLRQIQHADIPIAGVEKVIHQNRRAGSDVDDRGGAIGTDPVDQVERSACFGLKPAYVVDILGAVDGFPMRSGIHHSSQLNFFSAVAHSASSRAFRAWKLIPRVPNFAALDAWGAPA